MWADLLYLTPVYLLILLLPPLFAQPTTFITPAVMAGKIRWAFRHKEMLVWTETCLIFPTLLVDLTENIIFTYKSCLAHAFRPPSQQEQAKSLVHLYLHGVELCSKGFAVHKIISTSLEDNWTDRLFHLNFSDVVKCSKVDVVMEEFILLQILAVPCPA